METNRDSILCNLKDAGYSEEKANQLITLYDDGKHCEMLCSLTEHRKKLLECVRESNKRLDCLDFLIYGLKKNLSCDKKD